MKNLFFYILFSFIFGDVFAKELRSVHLEKNLKLEQEGLKAIGLLLYEEHPKRYKISSGFFYQPDLFITARDPENPHLPNCEKIKILVGVKEAHLKDFKSDKTFQCKAIVMSNPRYGFLVIRTDTQNENFFTLPDEEEIKKWVLAPQVFLMGYSRRGELLISKDCKPKVGPCSFCSKSKKINLLSAAWGESDCLFKKGMLGSPLFFLDEEGKWQIFGMMGIYTTAMAGTSMSYELGDQISVVRIATLLRDFGKNIDGEGLDLMNNKP